MRDLGAFAYAQARLQARLANRPGPPTWRQLQAVGEFVPFLESARTTVLRPWVIHFSRTSTVHEVELSLRNQMRGTINTVATWMPERWRPAVRWTKVLIDLPALAHLMREGAAMDWMRADADLKPWLVEDRDARRAVFHSGPLAALLDACDDGASLRDAWVSEWRRMWPEGVPSSATLNTLIRIVEDHVRAFAGASPREARDARRGLTEKLERLFRRALMQPATAFIYLSLIALDLEQLRGELVGRIVFPREEVA